MKYDLDYFIAKFEKIPEDKWTKGELQNDKGQCCAFGHCGASYALKQTDEASALAAIGREYKTPITYINDGIGCSQFGTTPKQRVVNYLKSLRGK